MSFKRIYHSGLSGITVDGSDNYRFTLQLPLGYTQLVSYSLIPQQTYADGSSLSVLLPSLDTNGWTGVTVVSFQGHVDNPPVSDFRVVLEMVVAGGSEGVYDGQVEYSGTVVNY